MVRWLLVLIGFSVVACGPAEDAGAPLPADAVSLMVAGTASMRGVDDDEFQLQFDADRTLGIVTQGTESTGFTLSGLVLFRLDGCPNCTVDVIQLDLTASDAELASEWRFIEGVSFRNEQPMQGEIDAEGYLDFNRTTSDITATSPDGIRTRFLAQHSPGGYYDQDTDEFSLNLEVWREGGPVWDL